MHYTSTSVVTLERDLPSPHSSPAKLNMYTAVLHTMVGRVSINILLRTHSCYRTWHSNALKSTQALSVSTFQIITAVHRQKEDGPLAKLVYGTLRSGKPLKEYLQVHLDVVLLEVVFAPPAVYTHHCTLIVVSILWAKISPNTCVIIMMLLKHEIHFQGSVMAI